MKFINALKSIWFYYLILIITINYINFVCSNSNTILKSKITSKSKEKEVIKGSNQDASDLFKKSDEDEELDMEISENESTEKTKKLRKKETKSTEETNKTRTARKEEASIEDDLEIEEEAKEASNNQSKKLKKKIRKESKKESKKETTGKIDDKKKRNDSTTTTASKKKRQDAAFNQKEVEKAFVSTNGLGSQYYIQQHVKQMKNDKIDFSTLQTKFVSTTTTTNTQKVQTVETSEVDSALWNYGQVQVTGTEKYMYEYITKTFGTKVDEPTPPPSEGSTEPVVEKTWEEVWKKLFKTLERKLCKDDPNSKWKIIAPIPENNDELYGKLPQSKPNVHYKFYGYEDSAYLFDYWDYLFQKKIATAFQQFWEQVQTLPPKIGIEDPYSPYNQLLIYYLAQGPDSKVKIDMPKKTDSDEELLKTISKIRKDFDVNSLKLGISIPKLALVYEKFRWKYNPNDGLFFKNKFDKYDYDGDGRLDAREFLFLTIYENRKHLYDPNIDFPFYKILLKWIDPIFLYGDCSEVGWVDASQLWRTLKEMKRSENPQDDQLYNIFSCDFPSGHQRTSAVNDFILKNHKTHDGFLTREEFATGIFLGYWDRQTAANSIYLGDEKTLKEKRWENKKVDIECERIKRYAKISSK